MARLTSEASSQLHALKEQYEQAISRHPSASSVEVDKLTSAYAMHVMQLQRTYGMSDNDMNNIFGGRVSGQGIGGQLGQANNQSGAAMNQLMQSRLSPAQQQVMKPAEEKNGVLMFRGAELPDKWMGAFYAMVNRIPVGKQWKISFNSEFSSDTIMLWLSMDEFSGNDADKVAATYLETINQRRLG